MADHIELTNEQIEKARAILNAEQATKAKTIQACKAEIDAVLAKYGCIFHIEEHPQLQVILETDVKKPV